MRSQRPSASSSSAWPEGGDIFAGRLGWRELTLDQFQGGIKAGCLASTERRFWGKEAAPRCCSTSRSCRPAPPALRLRGWSPAHPPGGFSAERRNSFSRVIASRMLSCITVMDFSRAPVFVLAAGAGSGSASRPWRYGRRRWRRREAGARSGYAAAV